MTEPTPDGSVKWIDVQGKSWIVEIDAQRITLRGGEAVMTIDRDRWPADIYVTSYQQGYLARFDTFERSLQFVLSPQQATPLLGVLLPPVEARESSSREAPGSHTRERSGATYSKNELLSESGVRRAPWPKVSPIAVWALVASSLAFLPVIGLLPALAALVLLVLHRVLVPRTETMRHSRKICIAAAGFLVLGVCVSFLTVRGITRHGTNLGEASLTAGPIQSDETNWAMIVCGIVVVILSLSVHEAGHAITAWWLGDGLAKSLGRVTLNPLSHIDPVGTVLLPIVLVIAGAPVFGYARPVPVHVEMLPRRRRAHILISIAGPGSNLLLAAGSLVLLLGSTCALKLAVPHVNILHLASPDWTQPVSASGFAFASYFALGCTFLKLSFVINVILALFNLIPIPPLDGSWVLEHLFPRSLGPFYARIRPYGFVIFLVALYGHVLDRLFEPMIFVVGAGLALLAAATGW